jgi:hypothetical protein
MKSTIIFSGFALKGLKRHFVVWAEWHSSEYAAIEFVMYYCPSYFCAYRN